MPPPIWVWISFWTIRIYWITMFRTMRRHANGAFNKGTPRQRTRTVLLLVCCVQIQIAPEYWREMPHDVYCLIGREDLGLSYMLHDPRSWFPSRDTHTHTCSTFTRTRRCTVNIDNVFYWYLLIYLHVYIYKIYIYMINYMHYVLRCFQNRSESIQWVGSFICIQWRLTLLSCQVGENCCMPAGLGWNMLKPSETFV